MSDTSSEPEGLFFRKKRTAFEIRHGLFTAFATPEAAADKDGRDHNQLKYVCRQLRNETKGLGVEVNDLIFEISACCDHYEGVLRRMFYSAPHHHLQCNPFDILGGFLETCSSKRLARIRNITSHIEEYSPPISEPIGEVNFLNVELNLITAIGTGVIASFLSDHPRATFNWYLDPSFENLGLLRGLALRLQFYLTDRDPGNHQFFKTFKETMRFSVYRRRWAPDGLQVSNFKIWPSRSLRIDDKSAARETYQQDEFFRETAPDGIDEALEE